VYGNHIRAENVSVGLFKNVLLCGRLTGP